MLSFYFIYAATNEEIQARSMQYHENSPPTRITIDEIIGIKHLYLRPYLLNSHLVPEMKLWMISVLLVSAMEFGFALMLLSGVIYVRE